MPTDLDLRRLPASYRWLLEPIKEVQRNPLALVAQPATVLDRMNRRLKQRLDRELETRGRDEFVRGLFVPMASAPASVWEEAERRMNAHFRAERRRIHRQPGGAAFIALLEAADSAVKNSPFLVLPEPVSHGTATLAAWGRIVAVRGTRGEIRSTAVLASAHAVWELVYQRYLQALWKLTELSRGRVPSKPPKQGPLMQELATRLGRDYAHLVDPDAVRIRNAVAHAHAEYVPGKRAVLLQNSDGWCQTISVTALKARVDRMFEASTRVYKGALDLFMGDVFLRPLVPHLPALTRAIAERDTKELQRLGPIVGVLLNRQSS